MRPLPPLLAAVFASALLLTACGSSSKDDTVAKKTTTTPVKREVRVVYATPENDDLAVGKTILEAGGTTEIAKALAGNFDLPWDFKVLVRNESDAGPHYDPATHTINLDYAFAAFILNQIKRIDPKVTDYDLGKNGAAIDAFIYVHEFAHLLIDAFDLPITGKEEDAADQLATQFMVEFVDGGEDYAFAAAQFFYSLAKDPSELVEEDFFDEHSLDQQRAFDIVCWIAGSSQAAYDDIEQEEILSQDRLQRCPEEWDQIDRAWTQLLTPHFSKTEKAKPTATTTTKAS